MGASVFSRRTSQIPPLNAGHQATGGGPLKVHHMRFPLEAVRLGLPCGAEAQPRRLPCRLSTDSHILPPRILDRCVRPPGRVEWAPMAETGRPPGAIRRMFGEIAPHYDLLNRLMTFGQDVRWRKRTVEVLAPVDGGCYLDVGTGTGDLAMGIRRQAPKSHVIGLDFTPQMLRIAQGRASSGGPAWLLADGERLPFAPGTFDGALSGFFIRNVGHLRIALREQCRVLRPGGRIVVLESSPPEGGLTRWFHRLHLRLVIPLLGRFAAGNAPAYRYLSATTREFLHPEAVCEALRAAGFEDAGFERMTLGAVAIHSARKPEGS